jgi:hypothetical protein
MRLCPCSDFRRSASVNVAVYHETQGRILRPPCASSITGNFCLTSPQRPYQRAPFPNSVASQSAPHQPQATSSPHNAILTAVPGARERCSSVLSSGRQRGSAQGQRLPHNLATLAGHVVKPPLSTPEAYKWGVTGFLGSFVSRHCFGRRRRCTAIYVALSWSSLLRAQLEVRGRSDSTGWDSGRDQRVVPVPGPVATHILGDISYLLSIQPAAPHTILRSASEAGSS